MSSKPVTIDFIPERNVRDAALGVTFSPSRDPERADDADVSLNFRSPDVTLSYDSSCSLCVLERFRKDLKRLAVAELDTALLAVDRLRLILHAEYSDPNDCSVHVQIESNDNPSSLFILQDFFVDSSLMLSSCRDLHLFLTTDEQPYRNRRT